jgi:DnaJ-domain-containing protein 1
VSVPKKPQDSVRLYQHPIRVDHSSVRKLQEVIATVEAWKQQRSTTSDDDND